jgi:hypothetical protein
MKNKIVTRVKLVNTNNTNKEAIKLKQVLYIPWILRVNLFRPTNPKDELV